MTGVVLRNYAKEQSLRQADGVIYGVIDGYITTISEIGGGKQLSIGISGVREESLEMIRQELKEPDHAKRLRIAGYEVNEFFITVILLDGTHSMQYVREFRQWFYPVLQKIGAKGADTCPVCGQALRNDRVYYLINGRAYVFHRSCSRRISVQIRIHNELKRMQNGHCLIGLCGSLAGGAAGALPYAFLYASGWFSGWVGILIGYLVQVGYIKYGGKLKKKAAVLMTLASVISVSLAVFLGEYIRFGVKNIEGKSLGIFTQFPEISGRFFAQFTFSGKFWGNILVGSLFAGMAFVQLFFRIFREDAASVSIIGQSK